MGDVRARVLGIGRVGSGGVGRRALLTCLVRDRIRPRLLDLLLDLLLQVFLLLLNHLQLLAERHDRIARGLLRVPPASKVAHESGHHLVVAVVIASVVSVCGRRVCYRLVVCVRACVETRRGVRGRGARKRRGVAECEYMGVGQSVARRRRALRRLSRLHRGQASLALLDSPDKECVYVREYWRPLALRALFVQQ